MTFDSNAFDTDAFSVDSWLFFTTPYQDLSRSERIYVRQALEKTYLSSVAEKIIIHAETNNVSVFAASKAVFVSQAKKHEPTVREKEGRKISTTREGTRAYSKEVQGTTLVATSDKTETITLNPPKDGDPQGGSLN